MIVEMGFGSGPSDVVVWTDVSSWIEGTDSDEVVSCVSGRDGESISPGSASITLDNSDGRWDPRNTSGPYFGLLDVGVPVRISDDGEVLWSGFVSSGFPQQLTARLSTVTVACQDTLGLAAQGGAPETALAATVETISPPVWQWWRPGEGGWVDAVSGLTARHTGALVAVDPVVNGDERSWGQESPDGYGATVDPRAILPLSLHDRWTVCSAWVRTPLLADRPTESVTGIPFPINVLNLTGSFWNGSDVIDQVMPRLRVNLDPNVGVRVVAASELGDGAWSTSTQQAATMNLFDGGVHHVVVAAMPYWVLPLGSDAGGGFCHVWVDGVHHRTQMDESHNYMVWLTQTFVRSTFGAFGDQSLVDVPYQGVVDHVMLWFDVPDDFDDLSDMASRLFAAGRVGWAGQRLDERVSAVLSATAVGSRLGPMDSSGVTTLQSYRTGDLLGLLQTIEDTEQGRIWCDSDGEIRFSNRMWPWQDPRSTAVQALFSDRPADLSSGAIEMLESGTVVGDDPLDLVNVAQVTAEFGRMQTVTDQPSIKKYGQRQPLHLSGLLHRSDAESRSLAEWLIQSRSAPRIKVRQIAFAVESDRSVTLPFAAEVSEGDLVRVVLDAGLDVLAHVRQIARSWSLEGQIVTLTLDSTLAGWEWWTWGSSSWGNSDDEGWAF